MSIKKRGSMRMEKSFAGIIMMIIHAIALSILYVYSKSLAQSLHTNQVAFLYKFGILIFILPWCYAGGGFRKNLKTTKIGVHIARGTFSIMGTLCFLYAIKKVDILDAAAIAYLENIILVVVGFIFFKEKMISGKMVFLALGTVGALLITKPGFREFNENYLYLFFALLFWAGNNISIKILGKTEHSKAQLFYVTLSSSIISLPIALQVWKPLEIWHVKYLIILAVCYLIHAIAFFKALKFAEMSTVMPYDYSRLVFTGVLGFIVFNELPDTYSVIGYLLISVGGIYLITNHAHHKRKEKMIQMSEQKIDSLKNEYEHV